VKKWKWTWRNVSGTKKIERPCWDEVIEHIVAMLIMNEKVPVEEAIKYRGDKTLQGLATRAQRYGHEEVLNLMVFFHFGGTRDSKNNHIQLTPFDVESQACGMTRIRDAHQLSNETKKAKWMAAWSTLALTTRAIPQATQDLIGTSGYIRSGKFTRKPIAALAAERAQNWADHGNKFEFVTIENGEAAYYPSSQTNARSLAAITTVTAAEVIFITGDGSTAMNFMQGLCLWMSLFNGFNEQRFYAKAAGVVAANGHPVYFSKPAALHNATIWHQLADQYGEWTLAAIAKKDYSCLTVTARILLSWGYVNMGTAAPIESEVPGTKRQMAMIRFTAPVESFFHATVSNPILESAKDDRKMITTAIVKHGQAMLKTGKRSPLPELPEASFKFFSKSGAFKKASP
jgi:hypothetical protein